MRLFLLLRSLGKGFEGLRGLELRRGSLISFPYSKNDMFI